MSARPLVIGLTLILGLGGCGSTSDGARSPTSSTAPSNTPATLPETGPVDAGTYLVPRSAWSVADLTVTVPDGWTVQYGHLLSKNEDGDDEISLYPVIVDEIYSDACRDDAVAVDVGPSVDDLVEALSDQPGITTLDPVYATLGGYPSVQVDLGVDPDLDLETCRLFDAGVLGAQVWYAEPADKYFVALPEAVASAYVLDVDGERQVFVAQRRSEATQADLAELEMALDSIQIKP